MFLTVVKELLCLTRAVNYNTAVISKVTMEETFVFMFKFRHN